MTTLNFNDLEFEVLDTLVAKRYAKFLEANIHEAEQFYFMGESEQQVKDEIDKIVYMLGKEPTENLNKLHEYFADNEDETEMTRLNNLIHYLELIQGEFPPRWGMMTKPGSNAEMELFPKDYTEFTLERKPGYLYINYAHVGKHFAEIAHTADWNIKPEQYVPQYLARPSFHIWLGDYIDPDMIPAFQGKLHFAHRKLKEKLNLPELNDPSMQWKGNLARQLPDLRIGYIPFAKITGDINNNDLVGHLLKHKLNKEHMELFKND